MAPSAEKLEVPKEQTFLGKFPENGSAILLIEIWIFEFEFFRKNESHEDRELRKQSMRDYHANRPEHLAETVDENLDFLDDVLDSLEAERYQFQFQI